MSDSPRAEEEQARFEELKFYQLAQTLVHAAYKVAKKLPDYEKYNRASQLRRSALSTTLNIAEGYGRYHYPDKLRFFYYARGSLYETLSAFISAHGVNYIDDKQLAWVRRHCDEAAAALNGYINYIRNHKQGAETYGDKHVQELGVSYELVTEPPQFPTPEFPNSLFPDTGEGT